MRRFSLTFGAAIILAAPAAGADSRFERQMMMLAPTERLEQVCDYTAMQKIGEAHNGMRPDRAVNDALGKTVITQDSIEAKGAAFRSHGKWYALSYNCTTTPDHMRVLSFEYRVGEAIPEDKWDSYGLWQ